MNKTTSAKDEERRALDRRTADCLTLGEVQTLVGTEDDLAWFTEIVESRRQTDLSSEGIRWVFYKDRDTKERRLIQDRRRFEDRRRREAAMATLLNAGAMINSTLDFDEVITAALETLSRVIHAEASSIILLEGDEFVITGATGPSADEVRGFRFPRGKGIAGWVIDQDQPLIVHDVANDARWFEGIDLTSEYKTSSILCVPLRARGRHLGVIELLNKKGDQRFDEWDLSLL